MVSYLGSLLPMLEKPQLAQPPPGCMTTSAFAAWENIIAPEIKTTRLVNVLSIILFGSDSHDLLPDNTTWLGPVFFIRATAFLKNWLPKATSTTEHLTQGERQLWKHRYLLLNINSAHAHSPLNCISGLGHFYYACKPSGGAVRRMRTRIGLLAQRESMRSIIGATQ